MGSMSDAVLGSLYLRACLEVGMYEKGLTLAESILKKSQMLRIDGTGTISIVYRMKAELLLALLLQNPEENHQHRLKEAENALIYAFERLDEEYRYCAVR